MNWPKRMKLYDLPPFYLDLELAFCDHEKFQWILWTSFRIEERSSYLEKSILIALTSTLSKLVLSFSHFEICQNQNQIITITTCGIQNFGPTDLIYPTLLTTEAKHWDSECALFVPLLFERWALALEFIWIEKNTVHE